MKVKTSKKKINAPISSRKMEEIDEKLQKLSDGQGK
jgi:hypothetical protein